ncbi:hypothetical protein ACVNP3_17365 [Pseudomonas chlororaphis subsp. piscium]
MIDNQEIEEIEELELQLLETGVSINEMVRHYSMFLLELIKEGKLKIISDEKLDEMTSYLSQALELGAQEFDEGLRKPSIVKLWTLEKEYREVDPAFSALARCVICCFGNEDDWERDNTGEETPLWFYLFYLKKVCPNIKSEFIEYFQRTGKSLAEKDQQ